MPVFTEDQKNAIRVALGYTTNQIPSGDYVILNQELARTRSDGELGAIMWQSDECYRCLGLQRLDMQESGIEYRRIITGDTNRTDIQFTAESLRTRERKFIRETDRLARLLGAINYSNPENEDRMLKGTIRP